MIQPITDEEIQYVYALAAMDMHARDKGEERHRIAADQFLDAKRDLAASGEERFKERNNGLIEYADVLSRQDEKPAAFTDYLEDQTKKALQARAEKAAPKRDEDDVLVVVKQDAHENQKDIEGELVKVVQPKKLVLQQDPTVRTPVVSKRVKKAAEAEKTVPVKASPDKPVEKKEDGRG